MIDLNHARELAGFHTPEGEYLRVLVDEAGRALFEHFDLSGAVAKSIEGDAEELGNLLEGARASIFGGCAHPDGCTSPNCDCGAETPAATAEATPDPVPTEIEEL